MAHAGQHTLGDGSQRRSRDRPDPTPTQHRNGLRSPGYEAAVAHYLSPSRRDAVKRLWEEPVNHQVIAAALDGLDRLGGPASHELDVSRPLTVVDIGAGTGDGLTLFEGGLQRAARPERPWRYIGIDPDPAMIEAGQALHQDRPTAAFVEGDVRDDLPVDEADVYLSAGVPWSHLTHTEFTEALSTLFTTIARARRPAAVVLDVLGRYSIEWTPRWALDQWDYAMSFFEGAGDDHIAAPMSFHSRSSLDQALRSAERRSGVAVAASSYRDRSVMVGRHTATGTFNPSLPRYRSAVNALYAGDTTLDLAELRFTPPAHAAPEAVTRFFAEFGPRWNARIDAALASEDLSGVSGAVRATLAADLCTLEDVAQRGLGTGHSLIGLVLVDPR